MKPESDDIDLALGLDRGLIDTPMVRSFAAHETVNLDSVKAMGALNRMGKPEEVAEAVCWLLCDGSSFVTGTVHAVDAGWTC